MIKYIQHHFPDRGQVVFMSEKRVENQPGSPRILILGGVAGGASCAARARRLSESAEIIIFERGPQVSFASCGLPYFVGDVITEEKNLLVATPELFQRRFNIEVCLRHEVFEIDRENQAIAVKNLDTGEIRRERYDSLVLAPGSAPARPPVPGIDLPGIFMLRTIRDSQQIKSWLAGRAQKRVTIIGGGFIGLETAENLVKTGATVTIVEMLPQVMPSLDPEMAVLLEDRLTSSGVKLHLGDGVARIDLEPDGSLGVKTVAGMVYESDLVLLATGVRPEVSVARQAGLKIGQLGGIRVDEQMHTSDKKIWAVGDAIETFNFITGEWSLVPLAGPASRQGRIAADVILGRDSSFRGVQGSFVCEVFGMTVAATGLSEKALANSKEKIPCEKIYLHPGNHASFYPGAKTIAMKLVFSPVDGKILGAQAVGEEGVEKRIDVISMAIQKRGTVFDLEEAEMCYAPQFGSAKDAVNMAGMAAANVFRGDSPVTHWGDPWQIQDYILDVREPVEYKAGHFEGAVNIPLPVLRTRLDEVPKDKEIKVYCAAGQRSYYATRILKLNGFQVKNISGGMNTYNARRQVKEKEKMEQDKL
jgi:NADPH-dependent 2,4-dienoyl-CoA reductase/sulfur reductase-like enzyme/rhodanese-related sulfurtransferase